MMKMDGHQRQSNHFSHHQSSSLKLTHSFDPNLAEVGHAEDGGAEPVVIGGMVLDINATPYTLAKPRTTTPGKVLYALGGVARNVAECMFKLGAKPFMISAIGSDMAGNMLLEHWKSAGLPVEGIWRRQDIETAVVCNIFDGKGEIAAAVASVEPIERFLTPNWIQEFEGKSSSAPVVMVDANLSCAALEASCQLAAKHNTPVWFEPVSVAKSTRVVSVAKYITFTSPNEDELLAMATALSKGDVIAASEKNDGDWSMSVESLFQKLKPAIWVLLKKGIKTVVVTLGSNGVFLCSKSKHVFEKLDFKGKELFSSSRQFYEAVTSRCSPNQVLSTSNFEGSKGFIAIHFPALPASVVRLTGAGDCLVGGSLASLSAGLDVMQSVAVGIAAAKAAVEEESNVPPEFSVAQIADDAGCIYSQLKVVFQQSKL